jgi:hypothetical protein
MLTGGLRGTIKHVKLGARTNIGVSGLSFNIKENIVKGKRFNFISIHTSLLV